MNSEHTVQTAYLAYYGRPADPPGLDYWTGILEDAGGNLDAIIADFGYSDEYNQQFGHLDTDQLIAAIYQRLFGRDPDAEGLDYYRGLLTGGGQHLGTIALDIFNGATGDDLALLDDMTETAKWFTRMVREGDLPYRGERGLTLGNNLVAAFHHEYFEYRHQQAIANDERDTFSTIDHYDTKPLFTAGWFASQLNENQTVITIDRQFDTGFYSYLRLQWPEENHLTIHGKYNDLDPFSWNRTQDRDEDSYAIYNLPPGNYELRREDAHGNTWISLKVRSSDNAQTVPNGYLAGSDRQPFYGPDDSLRFRTETTLRLLLDVYGDSDFTDYTLFIAQHPDDADYELLAPALTTYSRQSSPEVIELNTSFNEDLLFIG